VRKVDIFLKKTGLPAAAHLMIGDRELVVAPAKKLGMRTCLCGAIHQNELRMLLCQMCANVATFLYEA
jgi:FMN phosphatase YigB (HAD superfamily)